MEGRREIGTQPDMLALTFREVRGLPESGDDGNPKVTKQKKTPVSEMQIVKKTHSTAIVFRNTNGVPPVTPFHSFTGHMLSV